MGVHIEIHIGANKPAHIRHSRRKAAPLRHYYNHKSRHPFQAFTRPQPAAGNARFGVPLALVALLSGLSSYAIAGRPMVAPDFAAMRGANIEAEMVAVIEPAAGDPRQNIAQAESMPQPQTIRNAPEPPAPGHAAEIEEDVLRVEPLSIDDLEPFLESRAVPVPPRPVSALNNPASRVVSVSKSARASDYEAKMVAANRALAAGQAESAEIIYASLQNSNAKDSRSLMGLAVAHQKAGRTDPAMALYEDILKREPSHVDAMVNYLGLLKDENPDEAYNRLGQLWGENTHNPGVAAQLALTSARVGDISKAMRYMGVAIALEPENASHVYNLAVLADQEGASHQAIAFYKKALEVDAIYGDGSSIPRNLVYDRLSYLRKL